MAITTLNASDSGSTSRTVINDNFTDLDTTKADLASPTFTGTPTLPTGTIAVTQSANDNSTKVATTAYVDAVPGVATVLTYVPYPNGNLTSTFAATAITGNTTAHLYQVSIPYAITVNKISISANTAGTPGTVQLSMFSEDGQTRLFSVTTASIAATQAQITTSVSSVYIEPGIYYVCINPVSTANVTLFRYVQTGSQPFQATVENSLNSNITGEPLLYGTVTITADTAPTTITPTGLTDSDSTHCVVIRLDN